jgi:hypothetical protein
MQSAHAAHGIVAIFSPQHHDARAATPEQRHGGMPDMEEMMARMAAMDARIDSLLADVNSFTGEMKVNAMAELLAVLVKRQATMREEMTTMHEHMMGRMKGGTPPPSINGDFVEPDLMCVPER